MPSDVLYVVEFTFTGRFDPHYPFQFSITYASYNPFRERVLQLYRWPKPFIGDNIAASHRVSDVSLGDHLLLDRDCRAHCIQPRAVGSSVPVESWPF